MRWRFLCFWIAAACLAGVRERVIAATYYASPDGVGDGQSPERPFTMSGFWERAKPGDALVLLDGVYRGRKAMINAPRGLSGQPGRPITVRAMHDGSATLDGEFKCVPVALYRNDWFVIEGINAHNSRRTVVSIMRSSHCIVGRVCAWDAADGNTNIFAAHYGEHNLFEDCAGWGIARKTYSCSQRGNYTTFRRCFGVWEGCHLVGPKMTFTLFYNSHHITAENCIATWNARLMRKNHDALGQDGKPFTAWKDGSGKPRYYTNYDVDQPYGCFSSDRIDYGPTQGPFVYGCIAYYLAPQRLNRVRALLAVGCRHPQDGLFENCAVFVDPTRGDIRLVFLRNAVVRNMTIAGEADSLLQNCEQSNVAERRGEAGRGGWNSMLQPDPPERGAHIHFRYEDGKLTSKPLWPWPMNDRIKKLTGIDVTATVFGLGKVRVGRGFDDMPAARSVRNAAFAKSAGGR